MRRRKLFGLAIAAGLTLSLAACGSNGGRQDDGIKDGSNKEGSKKESSKSSKDENTADTDFDTMVSNTDDPIDGQTLEIAQVSDTDFTGIFNGAFSTITLDDYFFQPADEPLFTYDENLRIKDGAAGFAYDQEKKEITITLQDGIKWCDGEDVTSDDLIFPYEVIGDAQYDGVRYTSSIKNIVGMEEYHDGKSDTISGIQKVDDKQIVITYKDFSPSMLQGGGSVIGYALPKHVYEGMPVTEMEASDAARKNPITFGPYYISKVVPGESVEYLPNEYYYGGKPNLDKIIMKKVPAASSIASMKAKEYDIYQGMGTSEYKSWKDLDGYENVGQVDTSYSYIAFKLGKYKDGKNVYDPNSKMADKQLRQAIAYAVDNEAIAKKLYEGLQIKANSMIIPGFKALHNSEFKGYAQDIDKANKLLDDAGYKDIDGDGVREDKDGKPFKISFAFRDGPDPAQALAEYYIQCWKEVGLDVELTTGRLIEVNSFYDMLKNDDDSIDMFQAGWSTGFDPNQSSLYGEDAAFNYTRFVSDENTELLNKMSSEEAMDEKKAKEIYNDWDQYVFDEAFVFPTTYRYEIQPVSTRVTGYDIANDVDRYYYATVGVTKEER